MLKLTKKFWPQKNRKSHQGFTLTEILLGTVISLIVTTALLSAMIEILTKSREEGILAQTQQELERAIKFISNDIKESIYVYDFTQSATAGSNPYPMPNLPDFGAGVTPVIAFWKLLPIKESLLNSLDCSTFSTTTYIPEAGTGSTDGDLNLQGECISLRNRRKMYSLVVYLQTANPDPNWKGPSRILRYELSKYNPNGPLTTRNIGFIDPSYSNNFTQWPRSASGVDLQATLPIATANVNPAVLTDFVDAPTSTADANLPTCNSTTNPALTITTISPPSTTTFPTETRIPSNVANNTSFFVCVRTVSRAIGQTQDVTIYLRGNAAGQPGLRVIPGTYNTVLSPLVTRVTLRGVVDKSN